MDRKKYVWMLEGIRMIWGLSIILLTGDWFLLNELATWGTFALSAYFILSFVVVGLFVRFDIIHDEAEVMDVHQMVV